MKSNVIVCVLLTALPVACSSTKNQDAVDSGAPPVTGDDASVGDDAAQGDPYADAVKAASWTELANAPKVTGGAKQDDIWFLSPTHGFAVSGPASTIYETTSGGDAWSTVKTLAGTYFRSILFYDAMHGFASNLGAISGSTITDTNVLYATTDGGGSWNAVPASAITGTMPSGICNQTMIDAEHLVAVGRVTGPSFMLTSSDSGASWTSIDLNAKLAMLIDARFTTPTEGIVVGGSAGANMNCTILHTSDGGQSWDTRFTSKTANSLCWKISFPSTMVGYVSVQDTAGGLGTFAKTTDGGQTWVEKPLGQASYAGIGMGFITEDIGWVASDDATQPALRTVDGGETWTKDPVLKSPVNRFRFVDKTTAYAIGASVYKLTIPFGESE